MEHIKLILGNISFENGTAIVHDQTNVANGTLYCESVEQANELGELLCNEFLSYLIPSEFKGKIIIE